MKSIVKIMISGIWMILSAQQMIWKYIYNWQSGDYARRVVYFSNQNIICAGGDSYDNITLSDIMFVGLNETGTPVWGPIFWGGGYNDILKDMYLSQNMIYGCGTVNMFDYLPHPESDFWVGAITPTGTPQWAYVYDEDLDAASSIIVGRDGNIYACGSVGLWDYPPIFLNEDLFVLSLNPQGNLRWAYRYENGGYQYAKDDKAISIIYGEGDNIYVTGYISSGEGTQYEDLAVLNFTTSGNLRWIYLYNGPANSTDEGKSITYFNHRIYVTGFSVGNNTQRDAIVICIDTLGNEIWMYRYNGAANSNDEGYKIIVGLDGNIYVTGYTYTSSTAKNILLMSLDTLGNIRWIYYGRPGEANNLIYNWGNIYLTGYTISQGYKDIIAICIDTSGNEVWDSSYNGAMNRDDEAWGIACGRNGNIYIAGTSREIGEYNNDFIVINFLDENVKIKEKEISKNKKFIFPIFMENNFERNLNFDIFDKTGREVPDLNSKGLYFLKLKKENKFIKIIKLK